MTTTTKTTTTKQLPFFVYGTLKRDQHNECVWPAKALEVQAGTTSGILYDLGHFPAMVEGDGVVGGEVWFMDEADMEATLQRLDRLEGYNPRGGGLYDRRQVAVTLTTGRDRGTEVICWAYFMPSAERVEEVLGDLVEVQAVDGVATWEGRVVARG
jgi:gamma-glutamylcyclotransferase (GGCT)/AIG2-like uncharacterized protein YtfP